MTPVAFERLPGFSDDNTLAAFAVFQGLARASASGGKPLRAAQATSAALQSAAGAALAADLRDDAAARAFFMAHFELRLIGPGFLTGYYEPWVEGSLTPSRAFAAPLLARPPDLPAPGQTPATPYPTRAEIEAAERGA